MSDTPTIERRHRTGPSDMRVLVIGGTGSFSTRITQKALERGHEVLVCARSAPASR
jgi:nucleoside-diphosphate-sugar epimerase